MADVFKLTPTTYTDARALGMAYGEGHPVLLNLNEMSDAEAKRMVDFSAGMIFHARGGIERVTNKVFFLTHPDTSPPEDSGAGVPAQPDASQVS